MINPLLNISLKEKRQPLIFTFKVLKSIKMFLIIRDWLIFEMFHFLKRQYVVYPPEGPRPQSPEELREMAREIARKRATQ